jgi:hypothetical protein
VDIKKDRRDAATVESVEGMYPGGKGHGSAASDNNIGWDVRASSWQRGADTCYASIEAEKKENDERFGVPHADVLPNPADSNSDGNATLSNPHNFSNNPGFSATPVMTGPARFTPPPRPAGPRAVGPAQHFTPGRSLLAPPIKAQGGEKLVEDSFQDRQ